MPILSARALQAMDLPPPRAVIEGILVEGAALLAGRKDPRTALYDLMLRPQKAEAG